MSIIIIIVFITALHACQAVDKGVFSTYGSIPNNGRLVPNARRHDGTTSPLLVTDQDNWLNNLDQLKRIGSYYSRCVEPLGQTLDVNLISHSLEMIMPIFYSLKETSMRKAVLANLVRALLIIEKKRYVESSDDDDTPIPEELTSLLRKVSLGQHEVAEEYPEETETVNSNLSMLFREKQLDKQTLLHSSLQQLWVFAIVLFHLGQSPLNSALACQ